MTSTIEEDQVRDEAREVLGLYSKEGVNAGVGQITTFNKLGFKGVKDKPDGWYLPEDTSKVALILETKASHVDLKQEHVAELLKNIKIAQKKYRRVIGILYNSEEVRVFKNTEEVTPPPPNCKR